MSKNLPLTDNNSVFKYKEWLEKDKKLGIRTILRKLSDVKIYLEVAWNFKAFINFYKGRTDDRNPHEAYNEEDIIELIDELLRRRDSSRIIEETRPTSKHIHSRVWHTTACAVSFLYDIAGRAEDAVHLTWE